MKVLATIKILLIVFGFYTLQYSRSFDCREGVVMEKFHTPPYSKNMEYYSIMMDAPMVKEIKHPEKYYFLLKTSDEEVRIEVSVELYEQYDHGDLLNCY